MTMATYELNNVLCETSSQESHRIGGPVSSDTHQQLLPEEIRTNTMDFSDSSTVDSMVEGLATLQDEVLDPLVDILAFLKPVTITNMVTGLIGPGNWKTRVARVIGILENLGVHKLSLNLLPRVKTIIHSLAMLIEGFFPSFGRILTPDAKPDAFDPSLCDGLQDQSSIPELAVPILGVIVPIAGMLGIGTLGYFFKTEPFFKWLGEVSKVSQNINNVQRAFNGVAPLFQSLLSKITGYVEKNPLCVSVIEATSKATLLNTKLATNPSEYYVSDLRPRDILQNCRTLSDELSKVLTSDPKMRHLYTPLCAATSLLAQKIHEIENSSGGKMIPAVLYIFGDPNMGKSYMIQTVCAYLDKLEGRKLSRFTKSAKDEFWSNYYQQDIVIYDDWGSNNADSSECADLQNIYSDAAFLLNVAKCEEKGMPFNSKYVLIASNFAMVAATDNFANVGCLERRRDVFVSVVDPVLHKIEKELRPQHGHKHKKPDCSHLHLMEYFPQRNSVGEWRKKGAITVKEISKRLFEKRVENRERFDKGFLSTELDEEDPVPISDEILVPTIPKIFDTHREAVEFRRQLENDHRETVLEARSDQIQDFQRQRSEAIAIRDEEMRADRQQRDIAMKKTQVARNDLGLVQAEASVARLEADRNTRHLAADARGALEVLKASYQEEQTEDQSSYSFLAESRHSQCQFPVLVGEAGTGKSFTCVSAGFTKIFNSSQIKGPGKYFFDDFAHCSENFKDFVAVVMKYSNDTESGIFVAGTCNADVYTQRLKDFKRESEQSVQAFIRRLNYYHFSYKKKNIFQNYTFKDVKEQKKTQNDLVSIENEGVTISFGDTIEELNKISASVESAIRFTRLPIVPEMDADFHIATKESLEHLERKFQSLSVSEAVSVLATSKVLKGSKLELMKYMYTVREVMDAASVDRTSSFVEFIHRVNNAGIGFLGKTLKCTFGNGKSFFLGTFRGRFLGSQIEDVDLVHDGAFVQLVRGYTPDVKIEPLTKKESDIMLDYGVVRMNVDFSTYTRVPSVVEQKQRWTTLVNFFASLAKVSTVIIGTVFSIVGTIDLKRELSRKDAELQKLRKLVAVQNESSAYDGKKFKRENLRQEGWGDDVDDAYASGELVEDHMSYGYMGGKDFDPSFEYLEEYKCKIPKSCVEYEEEEEYDPVTKKMVRRRVVNESTPPRKVNIEELVKVEELVKEEAYDPFKDDIDTPPEAARQFLKIVSDLVPPMTELSEPCAGRGFLTGHFRGAGFSVEASDSSDATVDNIIPSFDATTHACKNSTMYCNPPFEQESEKNLIVTQIVQKHKQAHKVYDIYFLFMGTQVRRRQIQEQIPDAKLLWNSTVKYPAALHRPDHKVSAPLRLSIYRITNREDGVVYEEFRQESIRERFYKKGTIAVQSKLQKFIDYRKTYLIDGSKVRYSVAGLTCADEIMSDGRDVQDVQADGVLLDKYIAAGVTNYNKARKKRLRVLQFLWCNSQAFRDDIDGALPVAHSSSNSHFWGAYWQYDASNFLKWSSAGLQYQALEEISDQACLDQNLRAVAKKIHVNSVFVYSGKCHGLMLKGNLGVTVKHCIYSDFMQIRFKDEDLDVDVVYKHPKKDLAFFRVRKPGFAVPDITKHLRSAGVSTSVEGMLGALCIPVDISGTNSMLMLPSKVSMCVERSGTLYQQYFPTARSLILECMMTYDGDCGSFLLCADGSTTQKLLGIHTCASEMRGFIANLLLDDVKAAESGIHQKTEIPRQQLLIPAFEQSDPDCKYIYDLSKIPTFYEQTYIDIDYAVEQSHESTYVAMGRPRVFGDYCKGFKANKTKLTDSPFKWAGPSDAPFVDTFEPSILEKYDERNIAKLDPYMEASWKWDFPRFRPSRDEELTRIVYKQIGTWFKKVISKKTTQPRQLTWLECLNSCSDMKHSNPMDMQTSPGFPWSQIRFEQGKQDYFELRPTGVNGAPIWNFKKTLNGVMLRTAIEELDNIVRENKTPICIFDISLKDEPLKVPKIENCKTRSIAGSPVDLTIVARKYLQGNWSAISACREVHPIVVGLNPTSSDWHSLGVKMHSFGTQGFDSDFAAMDQKVKHYDIEHLSIIHNEIASLDPLNSEEANNARSSIYRAISRPFVLVKKDLYLSSDGGMPSGWAGTAPDNGFVNLGYHTKAWIYLCHKNGRPELASFDGYMKSVAVAVYGDDNIQVPEEGVASFWNFRCVKDFLERRLGQEVTPADKNWGEYKLRPIEELEFLKRRIVRGYGNFDSWYIGPWLDQVFNKTMSLSPAKQSHKYVRGSRVSPDAEIQIQKAEDILREASLKGEKFYYEIAEHLSDVCSEYYGHDLEIRNPNMVMKLVLSGQEKFHGREWDFVEGHAVLHKPVYFYSLHEQNALLSNFHPTSQPIVYEGIQYPSVENAYQATKLMMHGFQAQAVACQKTTSLKAKSYGKISCSKAWLACRVQIMQALLKQKFSFEKERKFLLDTGESLLVEQTLDPFWAMGTQRNRGRNMMGRLLMELRDLYRTEYGTCTLNQSRVFKRKMSDGKGKPEKMKPEASKPEPLASGNLVHGHGRDDTVGEVAHEMRAPVATNTATVAKREVAFMEQTESVEQFMFNHSIPQANIEWESSQASGTLLFKIRIHPENANVIVNYYSKLFNAWRGGIIYETLMATTGFNKGMLLIGNTPPNKDPENMTNSQRMVYDYRILDAKNQSVQEFPTSDQADVHFHYMQELDIIPVGPEGYRLFGGWFYIAVYLPIGIAQNGETKVSLSVLSRLDKSFTFSRVVNPTEISLRQSSAVENFTFSGTQVEPFFGSDLDGIAVGGNVARIQGAHYAKFQQNELLSGGPVGSIDVYEINNKWSKGQVDWDGSEEDAAFSLVADVTTVGIAASTLEIEDATLTWTSDSLQSPPEDFVYGADNDLGEPIEVSAIRGVKAVVTNGGTTGVVTYTALDGEKVVEFVNDAGTIVHTTAQMKDCLDAYDRYREVPSDVDPVYNVSVNDVPIGLVRWDLSDNVMTTNVESGATVQFGTASFNFKAYQPKNISLAPVTSQAKIAMKSISLERRLDIMAGKVKQSFKVGDKPPTAVKGKIGQKRT